MTELEFLKYMDKLYSSNKFTDGFKVEVAQLYTKIYLGEEYFIDKLEEYDLWQQDDTLESSLERLVS